MGQSRELHYIEPEPKRWFYVLEDADAPKDAWDWHDHAKCYGPFETDHEAHDHLFRESGVRTTGATITGHEDYRPSLSLERLIARATLDRAF